LENFTTSLVLADELYLFLFNLISAGQYEVIQKLENVMVKAHIDLQGLNVKP
jgi:hypothetical protein